MCTRQELSASQLVTLYKLEPHPEGGHYRRIWQSAGGIDAASLPPQYGGWRHYSTSILFLLQAGEYSRLHRLHSDEIWHFLLGGPLRLVLIFPDGHGEERLLGNQPLSGQLPVSVVPGGCWFAARPAPGCPYALVGCTVAPGFDFADFQLAAHARDILHGLPQADAATRRILTEFLPAAGHTSPHDA